MYAINGKNTPEFRFHGNNVIVPIYTYKTYWSAIVIDAGVTLEVVWIGNGNDISFAQFVIK